MSAHSRPINSERVRVAGRSRHDSSDGDDSASDKVWTQSREMEVRVYNIQLIDTRHCVQFRRVVNVPVFYICCLCVCCVCVHVARRLQKLAPPLRRGGPGFGLSFQIAIVASQLSFTDCHVAPKRKDGYSIVPVLSLRCDALTWKALPIWGPYGTSCSSSTFGHAGQGIKASAFAELGTWEQDRQSFKEQRSA